jgi:hypothetical protein
MGLKPFLKPDDIVKANSKLNMAQMVSAADLFRPLLSL